MKKILFSISLILMVLLVMAGNAPASLVGGASPIAGYGNDNGAELFIPADNVLSIELYDVGGLLAGSTFGFYFQGNPSDRVTIFGPGDETAAGDTQSAVINFGAGIVWDRDADQLQDVFLNMPGTAIGFFYSILGFPVYTEAILNGGIDLAAAFPHLNDPMIYLIGFQGMQGGTLALEVTAGITPVPEPSTLLLLVSGIAGMALTRRRKG